MKSYAGLGQYLIPILTILFITTGLSTSTLSQNTEKDLSVLKGKKNVFVSANKGLTEYVSKMLRDKTDLVVVNNAADADFVLDIAIKYGSEQDTPYGQRDQKPQRSDRPDSDISKPDYSRTSSLFTQKTTVAVYDRAGNSSDPLIWKRSKSSKSWSSSGISPRSPASPDRLTPYTIPVQGGRLKNQLPGLLDKFLKDFAEVQ